jgi:hypothetical protein
VNGVLPPLLLAVSFAIAIVDLGARFRALVVFVATAAVFAPFPLPEWASDAARLTCWISIIACGAVAYASHAVGARFTIALAVGAGVSAGAVATRADARALAVLVPLVVVATTYAARAAARHVPMAPKVVASWLIAVALLATLLQMLPVTPGYLPDHLE